MTGKIPQRRDNLRQAQSWRGPEGRTWGSYRKKGLWTLAPWLWHSLSPHSVCKKFPNLLAALLPLPDLSLKQCWRWVRPCTGKGWFPGVIRSKKECIKSYEIYFANALNLNDKGPSMEWVCFPKVLWPFNYMTLTQNFFECYLLFDHYCLTMIDELYIYSLYSYANKPNKSPLRNRLLALWEISHLSSLSRSCLVDLFSSVVAGEWGASAGRAHLHYRTMCKWAIHEGF